MSVDTKGTFNSRRVPAVGRPKGSVDLKGWSTQRVHLIDDVTISRSVQMC